MMSDKLNESNGTPENYFTELLKFECNSYGAPSNGEIRHHP